MYGAMRCAMHGAMHGAPESCDVHREAHPRERHSGARWARRQCLEHSGRRRRRRRRRGRRRAATQPAKEHRRRAGAWAEGPQPWAELGGERGEGRRLDPRCGDVARKADLARCIDLVVRDSGGAFLAINLAPPREATPLLALRDALRDEDEVREDLEEADVRRHLIQPHEGLVVVEVFVADVIGKEGERLRGRRAAGVRHLPKVAHDTLSGGGSLALVRRRRLGGGGGDGVLVLVGADEQRLEKLVELEERLRALLHVADLAGLVELDVGHSAQASAVLARRLSVPGEASGRGAV